MNNTEKNKHNKTDSITICIIHKKTHPGSKPKAFQNKLPDVNRGHMNKYLKKSIYIIHGKGDLMHSMNGFF